MTIKIGKMKSTMSCLALPKSWWVWVEVQLDVSKKEGGFYVTERLARPKCVPIPLLRSGEWERENGTLARPECVTLAIGNKKTRKKTCVLKGWIRKSLILFTPR